MRIAYPVEYYEQRLKEMFGKEYEIILLEDWHGLRTMVEIFCYEHKTFREVYLKKVFNGKKSTRPCRKCYLESLQKDLDKTNISVIV